MVSTIITLVLGILMGFWITTVAFTALVMDRADTNEKLFTAKNTRRDYFVISKKTIL
jgi:hypothetical protein